MRPTAAILAVILLLLAALLCPWLLLRNQEHSLYRLQSRQALPELEIQRQEKALLQRMTTMATTASVNPVEFSLGQELYYDRQTLQTRFLEELRLLGETFPSIGDLSLSLEGWLAEGEGRSLELSYGCIVSPETGDSFFLATASGPVCLVMDMTSEKLILISAWTPELKQPDPSLRNDLTYEKTADMANALAGYWEVQHLSSELYDTFSGLLVFADDTGNRVAFRLELAPEVVELSPTAVVWEDITEECNLP